MLEYLTVSKYGCLSTVPVRQSLLTLRVSVPNYEVYYEWRAYDRTIRCQSYYRGTDGLVPCGVHYAGVSCDVIAFRPDTEGLCFVDRQGYEYVLVGASRTIASRGTIRDARAYALTFP